MSFFQSVANVFSPAAPAAQAQQQQQTATGDGNPQTPNQPTTPASPLDSFADLWQNADTGTEPTDNASMFAVDSKALNETVGKMNFLGNIPPKVQEALNAGGESAVKANLYLMNQVAQQSFAQSAQATTKIVEAALAKQAEAFESRVSDVVKKQGMRDDLASSNPVFKHAAAAPILQGLEAQILKKYPNASPTELSQMAQNFLKSFADEISGVNKPKESGQKSDTDFSNFF